MTRFKLTLEYDGTPYAGWQRQENQHSVQAAVEKAVFAFAQEESVVQCAGRTDAGVHATGQVAHVDLAADREAYQVRDGLNHHLRYESVTILSAEAVAPTFHARFDATGRRYLYRIVNRRAPLKLDTHRAWHVPWELDAAAMHDAAQRLLGHHDFTSFRATLCQAKSPMKTLDRLDVTRHGEEIRIEAAARSFLHHQMRNMVGTLSLVGSGKWTADDVTRALQARDRSAAGLTAPPEGLYLTEVKY